MGLTIRQNLMAESALRNLGATYRQLHESITALSSGLRINSADDDAAGMAVRELMRADVASYRQGVRNANDAISMLQTYDGACQVIDEKLIRMKELATQASTGSYSDDQRTLMQDEFDKMRLELNRIATATQFNGVFGLTSASGSIKIHFGRANDATMDFYKITTADLTSSSLGLNDLTLANQTSAQGALDAISSAIVAKDTARAGFGAMMNRLRNTVANLEIQTENIMAAESQMSDVDVASEMAKLTRNQVMAQAGVAMLIQANSVPMMALALLGA